uniref:AAA+ ATPase domain-containing protein n=1 Tax=Hemiselmis andersenii TaxID=464988 RepID=A0A7S1GSB5_HEMAN|mmetsp:Transcript_11538/g.27974  ORF Transcript_11538/g.27974 Transcript_11538/m.27974 type:complete len:340 (+) Transcript_11538:42-1061(+)
MEVEGPAPQTREENRAIAAMTSPWIEKYRPESLKDIIAHQDIMATLDRFVDSNKLPHLLLYGPPGTGKTSSILAMAKRIFGAKYKSMTLELNASDERGIDVVKQQIKDFAGTRTIFGTGFKLIILDEADNMTQAAQAALRRVIENYTANTRFCLICNYVNKIIPALQSRCTRFRFAPLESCHIRPRLQEIVSAEGVTVEEKALEAVERLSGGDMRKCLNVLQSASMAHKTVTVDDIYDCTGQPKPSDVSEMAHSLFNDTFEGAYACIQDTQTSRGLALIDVVRALHSEIIKMDLPTKVFADLLEALALLEFRLTGSVNERVQLGALVGVFWQARETLGK